MNDYLSHLTRMAFLGQIPVNDLGPIAAGTSDYDYPSFSQFNMSSPWAGADGIHLGDLYKLPQHPTFSNESGHAVGQNSPLAGKWIGNGYSPSVLGMMNGKRAAMYPDQYGNSLGYEYLDGKLQY